MAIVNVKWGREKHSYEFDGRILADIRLGELRKQCHDRTGVPLGGLTLISGGATMKDDSAPLSCFGIKPNGQITMMGTKPSVRKILFFFHLRIAEDCLRKKVPKDQIQTGSLGKG